MKKQRRFIPREHAHKIKENVLFIHFIYKLYNESNRRISLNICSRTNVYFAVKAHSRPSYTSRSKRLTFYKRNFVIFLFILAKAKNLLRMILTSHIETWLWRQLLFFPFDGVLTEIYASYSGAVTLTMFCVSLWEMSYFWSLKMELRMHNFVTIF